MTERSIQSWRRLAGVIEGAVVLGLPFLKIKGESALRFDIPSLRLYFFGIVLSMDEFFIVLVAFIFLSFLMIFATLMFGRVWCGWVCPQTVLIDYTVSADKARKRGLPHNFLSFGSAAPVSIIVAASLVWYFIPPHEFIRKLLDGQLGNIVWGFWLVLFCILFLDLAFLRYNWCATVCPYAKLQSVMFDNKTLIIAFDPARKEECINCMACVRTCPVGIDIRKELQAECINCAACIDECSRVMGPRQRKGLIGYFWGLPGETAKGLLRTNVILIGSLTAATLFFLIYMAAARPVIDLTVLPNYDFPPRMMDEKAVNSFFLSIKNRSRTDKDLKIAVSGLSYSKVIPGRVVVKAGEDKNVPLYVIGGDQVLKVYQVTGGSKSIEVVIESDRSGIKVVGKTNFIFPAGR